MKGTLDSAILERAFLQGTATVGTGRIHSTEFASGISYEKVFAVLRKAFH